MNSYPELARRLHHDLIKNLDIPEPHAAISIPQLRVLIHRIFEQNSGFCAMSEIWNFKIRKSPLFLQEFDNLLNTLNDNCIILKSIEPEIRALTKTKSPVIPLDAQRALVAAADAVRKIEDLCTLANIKQHSELQPDTNTRSTTPSDTIVLDDDTLAMFQFMGLDGLTDDKTTSAKPIEPKQDKFRVLVVDDQLISVERLMAHPSLNTNFDWITSCRNNTLCEICPNQEHCVHKCAHTWMDLQKTLRYEHEHHKTVDLLLMDVRFDTLDVSELLWLPDIPSLNDEEHVKALQGLIIARALKRDNDFSKIPIILMTARSSLPEGANLLLEGMEGLQFVDNDNSLDVLAARMEGVMSQSHTPNDSTHFFWGTSSKMQAVRRQAELVSFGPRTVLITGPSGAGKSFIVENVIYPNSQRHPLVTIDLSAVPENLVESELFGHTKGSFSGADRDRPGLIEEAQGGILFLDEIGNLSQENQKKLLLFLNDKMVKRVGAPFTTRHRVDVKVVAATHLDLAKEVEAGRFRFDLYMRLAPALAIVLPTLNERREDLGALVKTLIAKLANSEEMKPYVSTYAERCHISPDVQVEFGDTVKSNGKLTIRFPQATRELFLKYSWPGNTRELETILDALFMKTMYDCQQSQALSTVLEIDHYFALSLLGAITKAADVAPGTSATVQSSWLPSGPYDDFPDMRQKLERAFLCHEYEKAEGDMSTLARNLFGEDSDKMRHKIVIRFNQLGISLRKLRGQAN